MVVNVRESQLIGLRRSAALVLPTAAVGLTFGLLAEPVVGATAALVMSVIVWSGTAQFATLEVVAGGGGTALAATTGLLANTRYLPMGFALAPSLHHGPLRRMGAGLALTDASFAVAHRGQGRFDVEALAWAMPLQYLAWVGGTAAGVAGASLAADPDRLGLDILFPVFYLGLLLPELRGPGSGAGRPPRAERGVDASWPDRSQRAVVVAVVAGVITVALIPVAPAGIPVLVAAAAALIGLRRAAEER